MGEPDADVLIVGGGPVGLSLALELDRHGVASMLVEPRVRVEHSRPRAKTTSARTMEHFRRWGIADQIRAAAPIPASWSSRVSFVRTVLGEEVTSIDDCLGLSTSPAVSPEPAQQIPQGTVEETLREVLAGRPAITPFWGWAATAVTQTADSASVVVEGPGGATRELTARWVIGADGPRSVVRAAMGARFEGAAGGAPNVNITFRAPGLSSRIPHPPSVHYWVLNEARPGVVGPLDLDGTWWSIATGAGSIDSEEQAAEVVRELVGAPIDLEILALDAWQARLLLAERYRNGRLFIVGDAAHQNPPWGGHGFNTGVGDAANLGWKLAAVLHGWAPEALLDSYERERRPVAAQTIDVAAANMAALSGDLAEGLGDRADAERIREIKRREFHADGLVLGYGYGPTSARQAPTVDRYIPLAEPGNRLPHRLIGERSLYDLLGPEFSLLGAPSVTAPLRAACEARGVPVVTVDLDGPAVLVRPDLHIAWVGVRVESPDEILDAALGGFVEVPVPVV